MVSDYDTHFFVVFKYRIQEILVLLSEARSQVDTDFICEVVHQDDDDEDESHRGFPAQDEVHYLPPPFLKDARRGWIHVLCSQSEIWNLKEVEGPTEVSVLIVAEADFDFKADPCHDKSY